uniref:MutS-like protein n=1 Tax=Tenerodus fallax TaxID=2069446 RepID=UPI001FAF663C|nr:MutS-like protein [Tenerodus fallax]UKP88399.1 MutS-like protein [Tenerodus fallax]
MENLPAQYFNLAEKNHTKYGISVVQFIQIGKFYEVWEDPGAPTKHLTYLQAEWLRRSPGSERPDCYRSTPTIDQIASLLNMRITVPGRQRALRQMGFPTFSLDTHLNTILDNGRTVVVVSEGEGEVGRMKPRAISQVHFPSYPPEGEVRHILSLYFTAKGTLGVTLFSPVSGQSVVFPVSWENRDKVSRLLISYHIREIVVYSAGRCTSNSAGPISPSFGSPFSPYSAGRYTSYSALYALLTDWGLFPSEPEAMIEAMLEHELEDGTVSLRYQNGEEWLLLQVYGHIPTEWFNKNYQEYTLSKVCDTSADTYDSYVEECVISLLGVLQFVNIRNSELIKNLPRPDYSGSVLTPLNLGLCGQAVYQLDIVGQGRNRGRRGTILSLIDHCSTAMGGRLLKFRLLNPVTDATELISRYEDITTLVQLIDNNVLDNSALRGIKDLSALHRKWAIGGLTPHKFGQIYHSHLAVSKLIMKLAAVPTLSGSLCLGKASRCSLESFLLEINKVFQVVALQDCSWPVSTILHGSPIMEDLLEQQHTLKCQLTEWAKQTSNEVFHTPNTISFDLIPEGYTFNVPSRKLAKLERHIAEVHSPSPILVLGKRGSSHTITSSQVQKVLLECNLLESQISKYVERTYSQELKRLHESYSPMLKSVEDFVARLDVALSGAIAATKFGFTRPSMLPPSGVLSVPSPDSPRGSILAEGLRHPLVEQLNTQEECVGHDISLGENLGGMLVFSVNGAGKSTLLRAIGVNTILAQAGMYVAADSFKFTPYNYLIASISGKDDLHKGHSAYEVKMKDLRTIVKLSSSNILVLGDEMCSGTDVSSGAAILAATVERLSEDQTSFVLSTHLHKVCSLLQWSSQSRLRGWKCNEPRSRKDEARIFHLSATQHKELGLIYERKLESGPGASEYGIEVMRPIVEDVALYESALRYRTHLRESFPLEPKDSPTSTLAAFRPSRHNPKVFIDSCKICGAPADAIHHIKPQRDSRHNGKLVNKKALNRRSNLVPVCSRCHLDIHENRISVLGWKRTSQHVKLHWEYKNSSSLN